MSIHLYAEHLVNIRTLSIQISLATPSNDSTEAHISTDGQTLSCSHEADIARIQLPAHVAGNSGADVLKLPSSTWKEASFRFKIDESAGPHDHFNALQTAESIIPWTATSLSNDFEIRCKTCSAVLVRRGRIDSWKDLPSENWAEMMDFWHCHRPDVPHSHDHTHANVPRKGYSADSTLSLVPGVGMIDPVDFLFVPQDCDNLTVGPHYGFSSSRIYFPSACFYISTRIF